MFEKLTVLTSQPPVDPVRFASPQQRRRELEEKEAAVMEFSQHLFAGLMVTLIGPPLTEL